MRDLVALSADKLPRAAKTKATRAIENVHLAYYEKGGIRDLAEQIRERSGATAKHIYELAVYASENARTLDEAIASYLGMCAYAEAQYKAQHEVVNLKDALPTWSVFKSNILRGMREYKLDPVDYRSEGAFRVAMQKLAEQKALPAPNKNLEIFEHAMAQTVRHETQRVLVSQIVFELSALKPGKVKEAEAILRETMNKLAKLVDPRKVA